MIEKLEVLSSELAPRSYVASRYSSSTRLPAAADQDLARLAITTHLVGSSEDRRRPCEAANQEEALHTCSKSGKRRRPLRGADGRWHTLQ